MSGTEIFAPFFGMMLLTFVVWTVMYVRRLRFIANNRIDTEKLKRPEQGAVLVPDTVAFPSQNFNNLFELPVLFYALCLYLFVTGNVDSTYLACAWMFLIFRSVHSAIHCTVNIVKFRFLSYQFAALVLWFMVLRATWDVLSEYIFQGT